jgi:Tfp pilus assembly protein PilV
VSARLRSEEGFGILELMIAMVMLNIGILAIVAAFNSGGLALQRASQASTAAVLADSQMELYRALNYTAITLESVSASAAAANTVYAADAANDGSTVVPATCASSAANNCNAMRTVTGPDDVSYRVDTYIHYVTPTSGRQLKRVVVVVRMASSLNALARLSSTFDASSG